MSPLKLKLDVHLDRTLITRETVAKRILEVVVTAPASAARPERLPLNLALVLDRSGSMSGDKLPFVQQAACHLIDQLDERDQVSVVSFDNVTEILAPNGCVSATQRETLKQKIRALTARGGTDLFSGWLHGANETAEHQMPAGVNRVLLLTDGQANEGETRQRILQHHAQELRQRGVSTTTFGVGSDFNQYLLEGMAEFGGGHYYFIETPEQIPGLFRQELGELMTVVARRAQLEVVIPAGAALTLLGEIPHADAGSRLTIPLGDLFAGEKRVFYFEALTPTSNHAADQTFSFELLWTDAEGVPTDITALARFAYAMEAEVKARPADTALRSRAAVVRAATAERSALKLADEGNIDAALSTLERVISKYGAMLGPQKTADLIHLSDSIRNRTLTVLESKTLHSKFYRIRSSRE